MNASAPSLRRQLVGRLWCGIFLLSAAVAGVTWLMARHALTRQFDEMLIGKARGLAAMVHQERDGTYEFELEGGMLPQLGPAADAEEFFQVWLPDGRRIDQPGAVTLSTRPLAGTRRPVIHDIHEDGIGKVRTAVVPFIPVVEDSGNSPGGPAHAYIVFGQTRAQLDRVLANLAGILAIGGLVLVPLGAALLLSQLVRIGLLPVQHLASEIQQVDALSLTARLPTAQLPQELLPIADKCNELLARMEAAFARERRFTSDVSHELRTPLTEARAAIELTRRWPHDQQLHDRACENALEALQMMSDLTGKLLFLVRPHEELEKSVRMEPVNLEIVTEALLNRSRRAIAAERRLTICFAGGGDVVVVATDPLLATSVLRNVLDNAITYARPDTDVVITAANEAGHVTWSIENSVIEFGSDDLSQMFEPFWRKDAARTGGENFGVGLSLVDAICDLLDIERRAELVSSSQRLRVSFRFRSLANDRAISAETGRTPAAAASVVY